MFYPKLALALLVILGGLAFHVRNGQSVVIDFYLASYNIPLSMAIALALLAGAILAVLAGLPARMRLKREKVKLGKQLERVQLEEQGKSADAAKDLSADDAD